MKKNLLFSLIDIVLVAAFGLIFGLVGGKDLFANSTSLSAYIFLLVTLLLPLPVFFLSKKMVFGGLVSSIMFIVGELIVDLMFVCKPDFGFVPFWICQACLIGAYLVVLLIIVAVFFPNDNKKID